MHTLPQHAVGFDALLRITASGRPFIAIGGRTFMTVPNISSGYRTFPIRSRAFRQWFFDQCLSDFDTIPTTHAFNAILNFLDTAVARDYTTRDIRVPYRIDFPRRIFYRKISGP
jgi:hypothetical protein